MKRPEPTGSIPWGTSGPDAPLYSADSNPFVMKGNQSENINNPIGAYVTTFSVNAPPPPPDRPVFSMVPFLSVAETEPVESLLDIFFETSLSGNLAELNALVDSEYGGLTSSNFAAADFFENAAISTIVGTPFQFLDGAGTAINASLVNIDSISIIDGNNIASDPNNLPFTITQNGTSFEIKTNTTFFYDTTVDLGYTGVYTITANTTYTSGAGTFPDTIILPKISLKNSAPVISAFTQPTNRTTQANQIIINTLAAVNGSAKTSVNTRELAWSLDPSRTDFSIDENTGDLTSTEELIDDTLYNVIVKVTDLNGNGSPNELSDTATVTFQVGEPRVNRALCEGSGGASFTPITTCGDNLQVQFLKSSTLVNLGPQTVVGPSKTVTYPATSKIDGNIYNVLAKNDGSASLPPVTHTTGALEQGAVAITCTLTNAGGSAGQEDDIIGFTIQYKPIGSGSWSQATELIGGEQEFVYNEELQVGVDAAVSITKIFNVAGEYRVLTTTITGGQCSLGPPDDQFTKFTVDFEDANYPRSNPSNSCTDAPL